MVQPQDQSYQNESSEETKSSGYSVFRVKSNLNLQKTKLFIGREDKTVNDWMSQQFPSFIKAKCLQKPSQPIVTDEKCDWEIVFNGD